MNLHDVLVFLDASPASEVRLRLAARVARDHRASLSAAFVHDGQAAHVAPGPDASRQGLFAQLIPKVADAPHSALLADSVERRFRECAGCRGAEGDWHQLDRADVAKLIALARAADLIILGQVNPHVRPTPTWRPEDIVVACGRPVLMVPYIGGFTEVGHRVLIAWDGSREAVRALNDALPMISAATMATIMTVHARDKDYERDHATAERMVRHLARHGIAARAEQRLQHDVAVSDLLLSRAMDLSVDLIVAGAYHRSPLRETLTGGVSRELFQHMTVPVLMSH